MCGISGIVGNNISDEPSYGNVLQNMTDSLWHRGPDDEGKAFFKNCALGFRRLSIIDLSENGHQPMFSSTKNECIVFNGEIYGYKDLRKQIDDYPFKSKTDTEVILALYQKYGEKIPDHLNGMFALAIWDENKQQLFCLRDRFGEKPFYYAIGKNGEFIFASEIKAILASGLIEPKLSNEAISHYLQHMYIDSNQTIYENISVLPPACKLIYKNGVMKTERYWHLPDEVSDIGESRVLEQFDLLIRNSIDKQLIADVEVGAFLSGGLDSGTITALSAQKNKKQLSTLGFRYKGTWDEMPEAREIATKHKTKHIEIQLNESEIANTLQTLLKKLDEPLADTAAVATYTICEEAAKYMKVVVTGNGGDELLGGYKWYQTELQLLKKEKLPSGFLPFFRLSALACKMIKYKKGNDFFLEKIIRAKYSDIIAYQKNAVHRNFSKKETKILMGDSYADYEHHYQFKLDKNDLNTCMKMDLSNVIPGDYMAKDDRISMMHSIELRTPFLDKDLVEFCTAVPWQYKLSESKTKLMLRKVFGNLLTENILNKKKQGFGAPISDWLKFPEMEKKTQEILKNKSSKIFGTINFKQTQKKLNYDYKHWSLLVLGIWMEEHL